MLRPLSRIRTKKNELINTEVGQVAHVPRSQKTANKSCKSNQSIARIVVNLIEKLFFSDHQAIIWQNEGRKLISKLPKAAFFVK